MASNTVSLSMSNSLVAYYIGLGHFVGQKLIKIWSQTIKFFPKNFQ